MIYDFKPIEGGGAGGKFFFCAANIFAGGATVAQGKILTAVCKNDFRWRCFWSGCKNCRFLQSFRYRRSASPSGKMFLARLQLLFFK